MKKVCKIIIIPVIICLSILVYGQISKNDNKEIVFATNKENNNLFSMYIKDNSDNYVEYTSDTWPSSSDYVINRLESYCFTDFDNIEGTKVESTIDFDNSTKEVIVNANQKMYCYLYFDKRSVEPTPTNCEMYCSFSIEDKSINEINDAGLYETKYCPVIKLNTTKLSDSSIKSSGIYKDSSLSNNYDSGCVVNGQTYYGKFEDNKGNNAKCEITFVKATDGKCPSGYTQYINNKDYCYKQGGQQMTINGYVGGVQEHSYCPDPSTGCGSNNKFIKFSESAWWNDIKEISNERDIFVTENECNELIKKVRESGNACTSTTAGPTGGGGYDCMCKEGTGTIVCKP